MNIVFLIGNGFDLNLKLKTSYSDFLDYYLDENKENKDKVIEKFLEIIKENKDNDWSDVEKALGKCTEEFADQTRFSDPTQDYKKCYESMLSSLVKYLKLVEAGLPEEVFDQECLEVFANSLGSFYKGQKRTDQERIESILSGIPNEQSYYLLSFNYTHVVDCLMQINEKLQREGTFVYGQRKYKGSSYINKWINFIHVHGDISGDIIFGVNDEKQIANQTVIEDEYFKNQLLKLEADKYIGNAYDSDAKKILFDADVIYLYGVSLGETDAVWWERINEVLSERRNRILIIHSYKLKKKNDNEILLSERAKNIDEIKESILQYGTNTKENNDRIKEQIYVDSENIFEDFALLIEKKLELYWGKVFAEKSIDIIGDKVI